MTNSPKPDLPPPKAYEPPSPPSQRDLGPPPPGYGRYADFERGYPGNGPPGAGGTAGPPGPRRNLEDVTCFKVSSAPRIPQFLLTNIHWSITVRGKRPLRESLQQKECARKSGRI